jgi:rhodanese-related sulfurtransferase
MKYLLITLVAVIAVCCACKAQKKYGKVVAVKEYAAAISADTTGVLIDVRTPEEYAEGHLAGARLLNVLDKPAFEEAVKTLTAGPTYYIYCRSGRRSQTAAAIMERHGLQVVDLEGGYKAWTAVGMEVRKD